MKLAVISLSQDVSFRDGDVTNFVVLQTASGYTFRAVITDESARFLVEENISERQGSPPPPRPVAASPQPLPPPANLPIDEGGAVVFGGDAGEEEEEEDSPGVWMPQERSVAVEPQAQEAPTVWMDPEVQAKAYRKKQKQQAETNKRGGTLNAKTVRHDAMGYPIVAGQGVDPGEVVGHGSGLDEDGVGQG